MNIVKIQTNITMFDALGFMVLWLLLCVCTLGVGLFFLPYGLTKFIMNSLTVEHDDQIGRVRCEMSAASDVGHIVKWILLSVCTLGIAYPFYFWGVLRTVINKSTVKY